jgi:zinc protease
VLVDQPGAVQAQIQLAATVPSRGEPGSAEMRVAAWILGAPVTGLLDAQVRELAGHSYGIRATVTELTPGTGLFTAGGAVGAGGAVTALETIRAIIAGVLEDGFTAAEHAAAAEALTRTLPLAYETPAAVAAITTDLAVAGLPPGYTDLVLDDIAMLHPGHVTGTARRHLGPDQLSLIAVGDAATLAGPLQDLWGTAPLQVTRP